MNGQKQEKNSKKKIEKPSSGKIEVLAPAGSKEALMAALYAGADAVYAGGRMFGARAYAENLSDEDLMECMDYCHLHGKHLYLTVNTLMKEEELARLAEWLAPFYARGLDAVIVQDLGALGMIRREFPELAVHASTQMSIHSAKGAGFLENLGVSRVVPARELQLSEIAEIHRESGLEIECFVHGALCYSYSGQCLMSSMIGGRSGNRGRCAQPCRLPWSYDGGKEAFLLSPKDICTLEILPELLDAGIDSLKIEGRMKRMEYAAGVAAVYRKYVDLYLEKGRAQYHVDAEDVRDLMDLYNRGGFSTGYYQRRNGSAMMSVRRQNHYGIEAAKLVGQNGRKTVWKALEPLAAKDRLESVELRENVQKGQTFSLTLKEKTRLASGTVWNRTFHAPLMESIRKQYADRYLQEKINGKLRIAEGEPAILSVSMGETCVTVAGGEVQKAVRQPMTAEAVRKQMLRTGNTPYRFANLEIELAGSCFVPLQSLNELRRSALEALKEAQLCSFIRKPEGAAECGAVHEAGHGAGGGVVHGAGCTDARDARGGADGTEAADKIAVTVMLEELAALPALARYQGIARIYLDSKCFFDMPAKEKLREILLPCRKAGVACWYVMPPLLRGETERFYRKQKDWLSCFDGVLIKNPEELQVLKELGYTGKMAADYNFYTFNREAQTLLERAGAAFTTCPVELNFRELRERGCKNSELLIYGRIPVMTSAQCLQKTTGTCSRTPGIHVLKDRKGTQFPVRNCCPACYNVIYNSVPLSMHGMKTEIEKLEPSSVRLMFTIETPEEILNITEQFLREYAGMEAGTADYAYTRGHYRRGTE